MQTHTEYHHGHPGWREDKKLFPMKFDPYHSLSDQAIFKATVQGSIKIKSVDSGLLHCQA